MFQISERISTQPDANSGVPTVHLSSEALGAKVGHNRACSSMLLAAFLHRLQAIKLPDGWEWVIYFREFGLEASPVHSASGAGFYGHRNGHYSVAVVEGIAWPTSPEASGVTVVPSR